MIQKDDILSVLQAVKDPEIPVISVVDLGVITDVQILSEDSIKVVMTPTFAGCPAIEVMKQGVYEQLKTIPELKNIEVEVNYDIPWSSNRITACGRQLLKDFGLAPPPQIHQELSLDVLENVPCPYCNSHNTILKSAFGSTLCRSIHYCNNCLQAFEQFKPL
ncbi:MAG: phenylacetate-CoA oxygenase subunit PaaJ [Bacteroidia bacterium]|nr:phenylacetate-CoA oxygenase subunit PaaJ [Bacteroidia bacterium]MDW8347586.1 1,2-phenylacetyl-CoA epoxidase subunit PaaD [Bacteroidia bacterium]